MWVFHKVTIAGHFYLLRNIAFIPNRGERFKNISHTSGDFD